MIIEWEKLDGDPDGFTFKCQNCHMPFAGDKVQKAEWTFCPNCGNQMILHNAYMADTVKAEEEK